MRSISCVSQGAGCGLHCAAVSLRMNTNTQIVPCAFTSLIVRVWNSSVAFPFIWKLCGRGWLTQRWILYWGLAPPLKLQPLTSWRRS